MLDARKTKTRIKYQESSIKTLFANAEATEYRVEYLLI